jgi:hypothetical protein
MKYYMQNRVVGCIGNSIQWCAEDNKSFVCNIRKARVFTKEEADEIEIDTCGENVGWPKDYIDRKASLHVNINDINRKEANVELLQKAAKNIFHVVQDITSGEVERLEAIDWTHYEKELSGAIKALPKTKKSKDKIK